MNINEFTRETGYRFQLYKWNSLIKTDIGFFEVLIQIMDDSSLNADLVHAADALADAVIKNTQRILDIIYENYNECDPMSLMDFDSPPDLAINDVMKYIDSMSLVVIKDANNPRKLDYCIQIQPEWNDEHGIFIRCNSDTLKEFDPMCE